MPNERFTGIREENYWYDKWNFSSSGLWYFLWHAYELGVTTESRFHLSWTENVYGDWSAELLSIP